MKTYKNLLSINRNAFRFLHDAQGFDFEKPYFIIEQAGKFTVNTVIKAVQNEIDPRNCKIILFVVPTAASCKDGLYFATLQGGKFDGTRQEGARYWDYRTDDRAGDLEYCWGVGAFENLRKYHTEKIYIIFQNKSYIKQPENKKLDFSKRYNLIRCEKCRDSHDNGYIRRLDLMATDGSGARFEYEPYSTYWGCEKKSDNIADYIDSSGYLLRPRRYELISKANYLRKERKKTEADTADFSEQVAELQNLFDESRRVLSGLVLSCNEPGAASELHNKTYAFSRAMSYFEDFKNKLEIKKYTCIDSIKSDIDTIKEKLSHCIA